MRFSKKYLILFVFLIFILSLGVYSAYNYENNDDLTVIQKNNETDSFGCCSILLQMENNDTMLAYRRDSDVDANVFIEKIDWHGIPAIKQYKTEGGYFCHVIITQNGWVIGLGGTDDGEDNALSENITSEMITDDYSISEEKLTKIQDIIKPYGRGHVVIKAPNGNYGFANVDKLKTGKLSPGQYISIPNDYSYSRSGNLSLESDDMINEMVDLSRSDLYGLDRREILVYDIDISPQNSTTEVYVSNEDGSYVGVDNTVYIDNITFNNNLISAKDIPIAPNYTHIGSMSFEGGIGQSGNGMSLVIIAIIVAFIAVLSFAVYKFVRFIKFKILR